MRVFGGSTNFFINPLETVETNQVAMFCFVPQKLKTLCLNIVLCVLEDDPETWMPCITRLPREMKHDINNRLAFQGQGSDKPVKHGKPGQNTFFEQLKESFLENSRKIILHDSATSVASAI